MEKFLKICEILTDTKENTEIILKALENTGFAICHTGDWGDDGQDLYVMRKEGETS